MTSLFALLLVASAPAPANADSSGTQYEDAPPSACGASTCEGGDLSAPPGSRSPKSGSRSNASDDGPSPVEGDLGTEEIDDQGSPTGARQHADKSTSKGTQPKAKMNVSGQPAASEDDGGGGSPLIPVLIVMAAAAAISVGVVIYRRKHKPAD
jgi:cobalamin biosynthesis Mg chelatase CobN